MKVKKISNVAILVKDLEEARKFFGDLFGTEFSEPHEVKDVDVVTSLSPLGIELSAPLTPDGSSARALERRGEGVAMIILDVPNLEEAIADMESHGVRLVGRGDRPTSKTATFHPKDLHGVMFELIERVEPREK